MSGTKCPFSHLVGFMGIQFRGYLRLRTRRLGSPGLIKCLILAPATRSAPSTERGDQMGGRRLGLSYQDYRVYFFITGSAGTYSCPCYQKQSSGECYLEPTRAWSFICASPDIVFTPGRID